MGKRKLKGEPRPPKEYRKKARPSYKTTISMPDGFEENWPWLVEHAEAFHERCGQASLILAMPDGLVKAGNARAMEALVDGVDMGCAIMADVYSDLGVGPQPRIAGNLLHSPPFRKWEQDKCSQALSKYMEHERQRQAVFYIRQTGILRAWAALEVLTRDVWIDLLNRSTGEVHKSILGSLAQSQISLEDLINHDFDLTTRLGTILAPKQSFRTVRGIVKAFRASLAWTKVPKFNNEEALTKVECIRHCIVHAGGFVDAEMHSRFSEFRLNDQISMSEEEADDHVGRVQSEGLDLVRKIAELLAATLTPLSGSEVQDLSATPLSSTATEAFGLAESPS